MSDVQLPMRELHSLRDVFDLRRHAVAQRHNLSLRHAHVRRRQQFGLLDLSVFLRQLHHVLDLHDLPCNKVDVSDELRVQRPSL